MLDKLKQTITSNKDVLSFIDYLLLRVKDGNAISDKIMIDGFMIAVIYCNSKYIANLLLNEEELPPMTDNGIQQLEKALIWLINNEGKLIEWKN